MLDIALATRDGPGLFRLLDVQKSVQITDLLLPVGDITLGNC